MSAIIFRIFPILISLSFLAYLAFVAYRGVIKEKYLYVWLTLATILVVLAIFPGTLTALSHFLGFKLASNLIFTVAIFVLLFHSLHLSKTVSELEEVQRRLAEEVALLGKESKKLHGEINEV